MKTLSILALGAVALTAASPAAAQIRLGGSIVVTPYAAIYAPSADIARLAVGNSEASMKHQSAPAVGTTASYWFNDRIALEGGVVYSSSDLKQHLSGLVTPTFSTTTQHANVWLGTTKLMLQLFPSNSRFNMRFGAGPAIISRSGSAYTEPEGKDVGLTDVGGAVSLCTRLGITEKVGLRLRAEDYIYQAKIGYQSSTNPSSNFTFNARTQHDFVLSAGLQFFLNR